jgi:hypothetical protein
MKTALIEIVDVSDITVRWRDYIYHLKLASARFAKKNAKMSAENLKVGNMYTYRNEVYWEGFGKCKKIKYPTQTMEEIVGHHSITFLN